MSKIIICFFITKVMVDLNIKILEQLEKNPEYSLQEIAQNLGVSKGTIRNRISKMKENGILIGYKIRISYKSIGKDEAYVGLDISPENFITALEEIKNFSFVREIYATSGDHVAIAYLVDESENIVESIKKINEVKGVRNVYPAFVQKIIK